MLIRKLLCCLIGMMIWGHTISAQPTQDELFSALEQASNPRERAGILLKIAKASYERSHDEYLKYSQLALSETEADGFADDTLKMKIVNNVGCAYSEINETEKANQHFFDAADIARSIGDHHYLSNLYNNIGLTFGNAQKYDRAIEYHLRSLSIKEKRNDSLGISISYTNIGAIYQALGQLDKAKDFFEKSFDISKQIDDQEGVAFAYTNLGDLTQAEGNYDEALALYQKYIALSEKMGYNHSLLFGYKKMGKLYLLKIVYGKAVEYLQMAYDMARQYNYKSELANICLQFAQVYRQQGQTALAVQMAKEALANVNSSTAHQKLAAIHGELAAIYETDNRLDLAYRHLKIRMAERDSTVQKENLTAFAKMEAQFQLNLKDQENQYLQQQQQLLEEVVSKRTVIAVFAILGLLLLMVLAYVLYRRTVQKQRQNALLEEKVAERTQHLQLVNKELQTANVELERFAFITSHDLKEPLRNINSFAFLARRSVERKAWEKVPEYLEFVENASVQMDTLIRSILAFSTVSKMEAIDYLPFNQIVDSALQELQGYSQQHNALVQVDLQGLGAVELPTQLQLVFQNLIENGIKFNKNPTPTVHLAAEWIDDQQTLYIRIKDNGIGIPADYWSTVFEIFKRLHPRDKFPGAGTGLAICEKIVKKIDGQIAIESSDEQSGTSVVLALPAKHVQRTDLEAVAAWS